MVSSIPVTFSGQVTPSVRLNYPDVNSLHSTVDVVIPCYNYARYLASCVHSILSQEGVSVRVMIIDDASSDDTARVAEDLVHADRRVQFRRHTRNQGHIATYNEGLLEWSAASYLVLISADDMLAAGSLMRAISIMEADRSIGMVYGRAIHFANESELPKGQTGKWSYTKWSGAGWIEGRCRAGHNVITSPEVVVRGTVQRKVGGYRQELPHAGDLEMWLRIAAVSDVAYVRGVPQAFYRVHSQSMIRTVYRGSFFDLKQRKDAFDAFFRVNRPILGDADRLQELANRALAREALWDACRAYDHNLVQERGADQLVEFARNIFPRFRLLREFSGLRRRQWLGPIWCKRTQLFVAPALIRRLRKWLSQQNWKRTGV